MEHQAIRLLLVEDNPGDARLVQEMLLQAVANGLGYQFNLTHVSQLNQAITRLNTEIFDVVLLDLSLPDSQGLTTLDKALNAASNLPIVVLSGMGDDLAAFEAVKAGAQDYLVKGFINEFSLPRAVLYAIERKQVEQEIRRRNRELTMLNEIIAASTRYSDPAKILEVTCREMAKAFDVTQSTAFLFNSDKSNGEVVARFQDKALPPALGLKIPVNQYPFLENLLNYGKPVMVPNIFDEPVLAPYYHLFRQYGICSMLVLPIGINHQITGCLSLETSRPRAFSAAEVDLALSVLDQLAGTLARIRLDQERQLLSTAMEKTAESIIITDAQGIIVYVNPAFEQVTGYSKSEVVTQSPRLLKSGKLEPEFYLEMWQTITAGQMWHGRLINKKKDGAFYTVDSTIAPVRAPTGQISHYVAVQRDVTQELAREDHYRQAQKMEAVGRLAGGIAHDFNNLLTVITGYTELLLTRHVGPSHPFHRDLEQVKKAGERASVLTRQLLAFSRKQVLQPKVLDLNTIITDVSQMLKRLIGEDITLVTVPAADLGRIKADPGQIEQIIVNLAVNARDAMPGGGKLIIETANVYLDEAYTGQHIGIEPGWFAQLTITDTGIGMDAATLEKIFEPFFTTKGQNKGTGLGLATVYGIVNQSGGHIAVNSEPQHGTTFEIYFPRIEQPAEAADPHQTPDNSPTGRETVLVVEDEEMVRSLVKHTLIAHGYTVLEAENGEKAVQFCRQYQKPIQLLLSDVVMPGGLRGHDLANELLALKPQMKILFMSGYPDNSIVRQGILKAGTAFLQKPFAPRDLAKKVREVLDN